MRSLDGEENFNSTMVRLKAGDFSRKIRLNDIQINTFMKVFTGKCRRPAIINFYPEIDNFIPIALSYVL